MIRAIIFDLGGVYFEDGTELAIEKISKDFKIPPEEIKSVLNNSSEIGGKYRRGEITEDEFWSGAIKIWGIEAKKEDLSKAWLECYAQIKGTVEIVRKLKQKGIKLFILSDNTKERVEYLQQRYNFLENFNDGVFSHLIHKIKPDGSDVFLAAVKKTGEKIDEVVYIEDKEEYVNKARELGIKTIHFLNPSQLEEELKALGLPL